ncbi:MAG: cupin domain-containing protein [Lachnospiraceae bacterium]|nr:cupin domain-containing protein [Lachnospiraceae bacterium]
MKCVVLAGGSGDALWPLSRRNYPKQFIHLRSGRSPFQEAVARNLPFCDEFLILTNDKYENIVQSQLSMFQGLKYRLFLEQRGRQTAPIVMLSALELSEEEELLVVSCDHMITGGDYNGCILQAQRLLLEAAEKEQSCIVAVGCDFDPGQDREGHNFFDLYDDGKVEYVPAGSLLAGHCDAGLGGSLPDGGMLRLADSGIFLIRVADYKKAVRKNNPALYEGCLALAEDLPKQEKKERRILYPAGQMETLPAVSIGDAIYRPWSEEGRVKVVKGDFSWMRLLSLDQVSKLWESDGNAICYDSEGTRVINQSGDQLVVVNELPNLLVVNDKDCVYITPADKSSRIKAILSETKNEALQPFFDEGDVFYTAWGCKETLTRSRDYSVKKLTILPGHCISMHKHERRSEHWSIVSGVATIVMDGREREYQKNESIFVPIGCYHEIRNDYARDLVLIEVSVGESVNLRGADMIRQNASAELMQQAAEASFGIGQAGQNTELFQRRIVRLLPVYKDYLWGGKRLKEVFGMAKDYDTVAESWVLSAHRDGRSLVADESGQTMAFDRYLQGIGREALGWKSQPYDRFPILVKFIDAAQPLSVQVHPADSYALANENDYGKNEMWYVLKADEGSYLYLGFEKKVTPKEVKRRIAEGTLEQILHKVPVKQGDSIMVPAGTIHAIGGGVMVLEVQQSSNVTYRLYDYNRRDKNGELRALHLEQALANMDYDVCKTDGTPEGCWEDQKGYRKILLEMCKYFSVSQLEVFDQAELVMDESTFCSVVVLEGEGRIRVQIPQAEPAQTEDVLAFKPGDSFFVPAGAGILQIEGACRVILSHI